MVRVRRCSAEDFDAVLALLHQLWPGESLDADALRAAFGRVLDSPWHVVLCTVEADRLIGFGSLTIRNSLWQAGYLGHIDELVVDREHRGRGIGTRLLEELVARAQQRGCRRLELDSAFHRHEAHRFYAQQGFERRGYVFSRKL
jgi:GNAT superfamily N-acetyltransferase